jgi:hypothetical protein
MKKFILLFVILIPAFFSCNSGKETYTLINLDVPDSYYFEMINSSNAKILDGILKVENISESDISGTYTIVNILDDKFSGLSTMKGNFSGQRNKSVNSINLNMNPKVADNNVFVNLTVMKYYLMGSWVHSTMKGPVDKGAFTVYKQ